MDPGRRDRLIEIESATTAKNSVGEDVQTYSLWAKAWANVQPLRAQERFLSSGDHSVMEAKFTIPYMSGLLETMRILHDGLYWEIFGIAEIGRREALEITAGTAK